MTQRQVGGGSAAAPPNRAARSQVLLLSPPQLLPAACAVERAPPEATDAAASRKRRTPGERRIRVQRLSGPREGQPKVASILPLARGLRGRHRYRGHDAAAAGGAAADSAPELACVLRVKVDALEPGVVEPEGSRGDCAMAWARSLLDSAGTAVASAASGVAKERAELMLLDTLLRIASRGNPVAMLALAAVQ